MTNVAENVWNAVQRFGKREAIITSDSRYSYRDLSRLVRGIQNQLIEPGNKLSRVGIATDDSVYSYAAIIAVMAIGAAYVPINSKNPPKRNLDVIWRSEVDIVIAHDSEFEKSLSGGDFQLPTFINSRQCQNDDQPWLIQSVSNDTLAYILFTSGSTGRPKGVPITHGNLFAFADATFGAGPYAVAPTDRFLQMFELTFDLSVMCFLVPLSHGAATCIVAEDGIGFMNVARTLEQESVTIALMVPSILSYMKRYLPELTFPDVRLSLFCGEALPYDLLSQWSRCVPNAVIENTYGPTEATIFCSRFNFSNPVNSDDIFQGVISIGQALTNVELLILSDDDRIQATGKRGELCIAGPQVMSGYWNDPAKSSEVMVTLSIDHRTVTAYRTGDLAYENEHRNLIFCGRKDFQVKIDGHRVELGEIEHQAREFLGHGMVAVLLVDNKDSQKELVLFTEADSKTNVDVGKLDDFLAEHLPVYMRPTRVEFLKKLPLNLNGKIDRPAISNSNPPENVKS